jgi:hypothetical protein
MKRIFVAALSLIVLIGTTPQVCANSPPATGVTVGLTPATPKPVEPITAIAAITGAAGAVLAGYWFIRRPKP